MAVPIREFSPAEAAAVLGLDIKSVNNAFDKWISPSAHAPVVDQGEDLTVAKPPAPSRRRHRVQARKLTYAHVVIVKFVTEANVDLSRGDRRTLIETLERNPKATQVRPNDYLVFNLKPARDLVQERSNLLKRAQAAISSDPSVLGGEPVLRGTRVPARLIGVMRAQGVSVEEIVEGYPSLDASKIQLAEIWAAANPARGRPKRLSDYGVEPKTVRRVSLKALGIDA